MRNRGQAGETMTWVVATIIILFATFIFIFATGAIAESKGIKHQSFLIEQYTSGEGVRETLFALLNSKIEGEESIKDIIIKKDYGQVSSRVENILKEFEKMGVLCSFYIEGDNQRGYLVKVENKVEFLEFVQIKIGDQEVTLKC